MKLTKEMADTVFLNMDKAIDLSWDDCGGVDRKHPISRLCQYMISKIYPNSFLEVKKGEVILNTAFFDLTESYEINLSLYDAVLNAIDCAEKKSEIDIIIYKFDLYIKEMKYESSRLED